MAAELKECPPECRWADPPPTESPRAVPAQYVHAIDCPNAPVSAPEAPKPGDMDYAGHYFRSKEGWAGPSRFYAGPRRKPSTDPRYVALCALEQLPDPIDQGHCSILRSRLRSHPFQVSTSKGRNPHAAPRRKDDRRG